MSITTRAPYGVELDYMPLEAFGGVGGHRLKPIPGALQLHGGGFRKAIVPILAITAAIAIPVFAPAIATSIGLSGAIGATMASAAVGGTLGAAAGAATAALGGGSIGRGALMGGIGGAVGGGLAGYASAPAAATSATAPLGTTASAQQAGLSAGTGLGGTGIPTTSQLAGQVAGGTSPSAATFATGAGSTAPGGLGAGLSSSTAALGATPATGLGPTVAASNAGVLAGAPTSAPNWGQQFGTALTSRVTNPQMAADIVLRAAGQLAGSAVAGSGLSSDQQQLVDMQMAELQQLQQTNREAFNQRLEAAQTMLGEARYFDPEYFGLQRARQQQTAGARAKSAGLRGVTGEQRRAESRRYDLATARDTGTAYDQGFLTGVQSRLQTQEAGLRQLPMPNQYATAYGPALTTAKENEAQRLGAAQQVGTLFGDVFGYGRSKSTG